MTSDMFVGFERKPEGLEKFLVEQGYFRNRSKITPVFRHRNTWPQLFYFTQIEHEEGSVPDWESQGYNVVAELNINYPTNDIESWEESERIAKEVTKKFNGLYYDIGLDEVFKGDEL